jgi:predicted DsbA family dithiol-disulfide isomerase
MSTKLTVEVWSDIACPWCYVGKRRFESALARFEHAARVELVWRAYELDPSAPAVRDDSYVQRLASKYGRSKAEAQGMLDNMVATGAKEGLRFDFANIRAGNTFLGHRLLHLARERGVQGQLQERFFRGYFSEGAAVGTPEVALRLAGEAGLDTDEANAVVQTDQFADAVRQDQREARELGVDGVPFFLLGRRYAVAGAQPADLLLRALEQGWQELSLEGDPADEAAGPVCGPEGC